MTPPHIHISFELLLSAGFPPMSTVGHPGAHGAAMLGIHGCGVSTPRAAAVAAATCGLARLVHIPKGIMFTIGLLSMMVAQGLLQPNALLSGSTPSCDGAAPNEQAHIAPCVTSVPINSPLF